jgi:hypothetical protein
MYLLADLLHIVSFLRGPFAQSGKTAYTPVAQQRAARYCEEVGILIVYRFATTSTACCSLISVDYPFLGPLYCDERFDAYLRSVSTS